MDPENAPPQETKKKPNIEVRYEQLDPKDSLIQVDSEKLAHTLKELGYSDKVLVPLVLSGKDTVRESGGYDALRKIVVINQEKVVRQMRAAYKNVLSFFEDNPNISADMQDDTFWQKVQQSEIYKKLWPGNWPYLLVENQSIPFHSGNADRRNTYLQAAKEGALTSQKYALTREEQIERAQDFYARQLQKLSRREVSKTLGHEYEHANNPVVKTAKIIATTVGSLTASFGALLGYANVRDAMTLPEIVTGIGLIGVSGGIGLVKGVASNEQASYNAETQNVDKIAECFHINEEVFQRRVLGKEETQS